MSASESACSWEWTSPTPTGVLVGVLVGVFVTAPSPHSPVWHSKAPMSQPEPCGREMPRWSVAGGGQPTAASMAGLPEPSAWVCMGPPLSASAWRRAARVGIVAPQVVPGFCWFPPPSTIVPLQLPPLLASIMVFLRVTVPDPFAMAAPGPDSWELESTVQLVTVTLPPLFRIAVPPAVPPLVPFWLNVQLVRDSRPPRFRIPAPPPDWAALTVNVLPVIVTVAKLRMKIPPPSGALLLLKVVLVIVRRAGAFALIEPFK